MEKRAVIYLRVSDESQIDNNSLETQEKSCRKFAETKGYEIVEPIYREEGESGKQGHIRPEFRKLLTFCCNKKNRIDAIVVYKYDRFSRSLEDALATISLLARYNIEVLSVIEPLEQGPIGKALRNILFILAELDNELKGARVKDNMQAVFRSGLWPFKSPVGYRRQFRTKEENKGLPVIPDKDLAPIVTKMFENAAKGIYTKAQLARMMNVEGFGEHYHTKADHKVVLNILTKSFYYGSMYAPKWNEYAVGKHEPLTDEQTWKRAYNYLILKKKNFNYQDVEQYPLKGYLKCEYCGDTMTTSPSRGSKGIVNYYECKNKKCRKLRINSKSAHEQFIQILKRVQPTERVIKLFQHMVFEEWDKIINTASEEATKIEKRIEELKKELTSIRKAKDEGFYTPEQAKEEADKIQQELVVLSVEKSDVRIEQYNTEIVRQFTERFLKDLTLLWDKLDLPKRQAFLEKAFKGSLMCSKNKTIRTESLSPSFALITALASEDGKNVTPQGIEPWFVG